MAKEHRLAGKSRINRSDLIGEKVLTIGEHHLFHRQIAELAEVHVGRRIEQPQRAIDLERRHIRPAAEQYRDDNLVNVTGRNVLLARLHPIAKLSFAEAGLSL